MTKTAPREQDWKRLEFLADVISDSMKRNGGRYVWDDEVKRKMKGSSP